jgi:phosphatidylserine decarboxylase
MRIHREGYATIALVGAVLGVFNILIAPRRHALPLRIGSLLLWGFFVQFFRSPVRSTIATSDEIVSPADGTIVAVEPVYEGEFFQENKLKISIYMSALNVHVNRIPLNGNVVYTKYHPGKYLVAFHPKASELNERNTVVLQDQQGRQILIRQIAGLLARRIVSYVNVGATVRAGEELGFIKFGSRCDVFLPTNAVPRVKLEDQVKGGETILAELKNDI